MAIALPPTLYTPYICVNSLFESGQNAFDVPTFELPPIKLGFQPYVRNHSVAYQRNIFGCTTGTYVIVSSVPV